MKRLIILLISMISYQFCMAQLESAIWYFGHHVGLDFNSGEPEVIVNSAMNTLEGCASISNANGELLFYTDGDTVYNRNHQIMTNGTGLLGHTSSTQSAIIVKQPGSTHIYYIFAVDGISGAGQGMTYSEVDMNLDNGNGAITEIKNIELIEQADEKVCAVKHQNGQDYWIVAKVGGETIYHSYLLTDQGVDTNPVISTIGIHDIGIGYLKPSYDGTKIAAAFFSPFFLIPFQSPPFAELYDFDNSTGVLSNYQAIEQDIQGYNHNGYGIEFSPNNERLYVSVEKEIFQYDLTAGTTQDIVNSKVVIVSDNTIPDSISAFPYMGMQLALDGKIYIASAYTLNLHVIDSPNEIGTACNFLADHIILDTNLANYSYFGLPSFSNDYVINTPNPPTIQSQYHCQGDSTIFSIDSTFYADSTITSYTYDWDFNDPNSGSNNTSNLANPSHVFTTNGDYNVSVSITNNEGQSVSQTLQVSIIENPQVDLGADLTLCNNELHSLDASITNGTYLWQDGSTDANFSTNEEGLFWVEVKLGECSARDSVEIQHLTPAEAILSIEKTSCESARLYLTISGDHPPYSITYSNGSNEQDIQTNQSTHIDIDEEGNYSILSITDALGCQGNHSGEVSFDKENSLNADFDFTPKDAYFDDATITFNNFSDEHSYASWDFGDGNSYEGLGSTIKHTYHASGHYSVTLTIKDSLGCTDEVNKIVSILTYGFFLPNAFTPSELGDPDNNFFGLQTDKLNSFTMMIYDRWGNELYRTSDLSKPWDGKYKNRLLPIGVYTYHLRIISLENRVVTLNGTVTLMR